MTTRAPPSAWLVPAPAVATAAEGAAVDELAVDDQGDEQLDALDALDDDSDDDDGDDE